MKVVSVDSQRVAIIISTPLCCIVWSACVRDIMLTWIERRIRWYTQDVITQYHSYRVNDAVVASTSRTATSELTLNVHFLNPQNDHFSFSAVSPCTDHSSIRRIVILMEGERDSAAKQWVNIWWWRFARTGLLQVLKMSCPGKTSSSSIYSLFCCWVSLSLSLSLSLSPSISITDCSSENPWMTWIQFTCFVFFVGFASCQVCYSIDHVCAPDSNDNSFRHNTMPRMKYVKKRFQVLCARQ